MADLKTQNSLVLTLNTLLRDCCCDVSADAKYWEAVGCDAYSVPGLLCTTLDPCVFPDRRYINTRSICDGGDDLICECQRLNFLFSSGLTTSNPSAVQWCIASNTNRATGVFNTTGIRLSSRRVSTNITYTNNFIYSNYTTVTELATAINNYEPIAGYFPHQLLIDELSPSGFPAAFNSVTYTNNSPSTCTNVAVKPPGLYITWSGNVSPFIEWNANPDVLKETIQNRLRTMSGLSTIRVYGADINAFLYDSSSNPNSLAVFYITFEGSQCGLLQTNLTQTHHLFKVEGAGSATAPYFEYGTYINGWTLDGFQGYNHVPFFLTHCPYEDTNYVDPDGDVGYAAFTTEIQCCPQRGVHMGPSQDILDAGVYGPAFDQLENTIIAASGRCYKVSPFYFIFGKEGRFDDNQSLKGSSFIKPDCTYSTSGECANHLPCNCVPELFVPSFSEEVPWGAYGSYYYGMESEFHPAFILNLFGQNFMADNFYQGLDYAPSGRISTRGSWTNTTGIIIEFRFYQTEPFYIGIQDVNFSDRIIGRINPSGLISGLTISSGNTGRGDTTLTFNTDGKSVQDFLNAINNLRMMDVSGIWVTGVQRCRIFNFCGAADDTTLSAIPASKINNLSTELFDVWRQSIGDVPAYRISDPTTDVYGYSASHIWPSPKFYESMFLSNCHPCYGAASCVSLPDVFNVSVAGKERRTAHPPPCRRTKTEPHYNSTYDAIWRQTFKPFWTALQGCERTVATVIKSSTTDFDPLARSLNLFASGRTLYISATSGATTLATTGMVTNRSGIIYTVSQFKTDLDNLTFKWFDNPARTYPPVSASGGEISGTIYLDDGTWWDGVNPTDYGVGSQTPTNWGYIEPLFASAQQDIFSGGIVNLRTWIRNRCTGTIFVNEQDCSLNGNPRCVPPPASKIDPPIRVNCEGENIIEGSWLVTYGCTSYNCKIEWFIKADRCSCTTAPICNPDTGPPIYAPHVLNRELYDGCQYLSQPSFYMCENNLHPQCDIPFLIKVPYQIVCISGDSSCFFGDCVQDWTIGCIGRCPVDESIPEDDLQVSYATNHFCLFGDNCLMNAAYEGWCQSINPALLNKVRRQDIPRSWPPSAFIMERTTKPFCSTYVNPFDVDPFAPFGCGTPLNLSPKYDYLTPIWPHVPFEFLVLDEGIHNGWPCMLNHMFENTLWAYVRPKVKPFYKGLACTGVGDNTCNSGRMDIDCNTRCCYCGFKCTLPSGCYQNSPVRNCKATETATRTDVLNGYYICGYQKPDVLIGPGSCHYGPGCDCPSTPFAPQHPCYDGTSAQTTTYDFTRQYSASAVAGYEADEVGCFPVILNMGCCWGASGFVRDVITYGGCGGVTCFYQPCSPPPSNACSPIGYCNSDTLISFDCTFSAGSFILSYPSCTTENASSYYCPTSDSCNPQGCTTVIGPYNETSTYTCSTSTTNVCGFGSASFEYDFTEDLSGAGASTDCLGNPVTLGLRFIGGGVNNAGCTCNSWAGAFAYQGGQTITRDGSMTTSDNGCDPCAFDDLAQSPSYNYINNFNVLWQCGFYNNTNVSASGNHYLIQ